MCGAPGGDTPVCPAGCGAGRLRTLRGMRPDIRGITLGRPRPLFLATEVGRVQTPLGSLLEQGSAPTPRAAPASPDQRRRGTGPGRPPRLPFRPPAEARGVRLSFLLTPPHLC